MQKITDDTADKEMFQIKFAIKYNGSMRIFK